MPSQERRLAASAKGKAASHQARSNPTPIKDTPWEQQAPCKDNAWSLNVGAETSVQAFNDTVDGPLYSAQGYVVIRQLIGKREMRLLARVLHQPMRFPTYASALREVQSSRYAGQPHRLKVHLTVDEVLKAVEAEPDSARLPISPRSLFNPLFFVAYSILGRTHEHKYSISVDYRQLLEEVATLGVHDNAALPGSTFQNPHWDVANTNGGNDRVIVDLPLVDVNRENAPLQIWPGTHETAYEQCLTHPEVIVPQANHFRQYAHPTK